MTTNKPEVFRVLGHRLLDDGPVERLPYRWIRVIRLSDYEALQAECEKLRKDAARYRRLIELGEDFQWENIIRVDISEFPSRADAIDAVMQGDKP